MSNVLEDIPLALRPAADAALAWINRERGAQFKLTGLVDAEEALARPPGEPMEFGVVLCEDDRCLREQVRVVPEADGFSVSAVDTGEAAIPALLDPPPGVRSTWLDEQLAKHSFILLLFYRGRW